MLNQFRARTGHHATSDLLVSLPNIQRIPLSSANLLYTFHFQSDSSHLCSALLTVPLCQESLSLELFPGRQLPNHSWSRPEQRQRVVGFPARNQIYFGCPIDLHPCNRIADGDFLFASIRNGKRGGLHRHLPDILGQDVSFWGHHVFLWRLLCDVCLVRYSEKQQN